MPELIPVSQPDFGPLESSAVQAVLASHWVGMGPKTAEFESLLAELLQARHVIATSSCTAALHLSLAALERDGRREIIVPSLTFAATIQAILLAGYVPVFAEVDVETLTLDCEDVLRRLGKRTRAILPVHFAGLPCDSESLREIAGSAGIDVISDSAHAFGSNYRGEPLIQRETASCYSFSANKNISCGEGGAIATQSEALAARMRQSRFLGIDQPTWERHGKERPWEYSVCGMGFRYHMSDLNAAIGLAQLERLEGFTHRRRELAALYDILLQDLPGILSIRRDLDHTIPHLYTLRVVRGLRDSLYAHLRAHGINCGVHYVPNHLQPAFTGFTRPLPVTEGLADQIISLPLHTRLTNDDVERIVECLRSFLSQADSIPASHPASELIDSNT